MRSRADRSFDVPNQSDSPPPVPGALVELFLGAISDTVAVPGSDDGVSGPPAAMTWPLLLDDRVVRYWLNRIEILAWRLALDPTSLDTFHFEASPRLAYRTFRQISSAGSRIQSKKRHPRQGARLESRVASGSEELLLPVVAEQRLQAQGAFLGLPVGTVVIEGEDSQFGRIAGLPAGS